MSTDYRPIDTKPREADGSQIVSFDTDEPIEVVTETKVEQVPVEEPVKAQEAPVEAPKEKEHRQSRAQKRIKELHAKNAEKDAIIEQERREKEELRRQLLQGHVSTKESFKTTLEGQIKSLTGQMAAAMTSGDANLVVQLQDQLINSKMELASLNKELTANHQEVKQTESAPNRQYQAAPQVPERALEWIDEHPEFNSDELFKGTALFYNNQLLREGYDANSEDFYSELDSRMSKRFPELFGIASQNSVQLSQNKLSSDQKQPDGNQVVDVAPATSTKVRTVEQVVSGSSRPSASSIPQRKSTQVTLSAQDVKQAEAWGLSLEQMARRIAHAENNKGANGYVPINMKS